MRASCLFAWRVLVRGRMLPWLLVAVALVHYLMPAMVRSDGSAAGELEMFIRAVSGSAAALILVSTLVSACGMIAREREEKCLALAVVRPVNALAVVYGRWLALVAASAAAFMLSGVLTLVMPPDGAGRIPDCRHHYAPSLPPPATVAGHLLKSYLADPKTPEAVKRAPRRAVLNLLTTKEIDRYDVISPGKSIAWPYDIEDLAEKVAAGEPLSLKVRFSTQFELVSPVAGQIAIGGYALAISNNTQSVLELPLKRSEENLAGAGKGAAGKLALDFANTGKSTVMIRPRRDLEVLAPADSFGWNLLRAELELWAMAGLLAALGLFLSAALSRPVAVVTALVAYAIVLMAPSVIAQFPDEFNATWAERLGLALSRAIEMFSAGLAAPSPISDLATARAIEWRALAKVLAGNLIVLPALLLTLAAFIIRRKPQDG